LSLLLALSLTQLLTPSFAAAQSSQATPFPVIRAAAQVPASAPSQIKYANDAAAPMSTRPAFGSPHDKNGQGKNGQGGAHAVFTASQPDELLLVGGKKGITEEVDFVVSTDVPGPERLFRRESEAVVFERIKQETKKKAGSRPVIFPEYTPLTRDPFMPRMFPLMVEAVEPNYLAHKRLFFEQQNFERHGWDCSFLTPAINFGAFYYDIATLPIHYFRRPFDCTDCSAGKCLPGDPTPLYLYHNCCFWRK
jgi:hypothetical protein